MAHERTAKFSKDAKNLIQHMLSPDPSERATLAEVRESKFFKRNSTMKKAEVQEALRYIKTKLNESLKTGTSRDVGAIRTFCEAGNELNMTKACEYSFKTTTMKKIMDATSDKQIEDLLTEQGLTNKLAVPFVEKLAKRKAELQKLVNESEYAMTAKQVAGALGEEKVESWLEKTVSQLINRSTLMGDTLGFCEPKLSDSEYNRLTKHYEQCQVVDKVTDFRRFEDVVDNALHVFEVKATMGVVYHSVVQDYLGGLQKHADKGEFIQQDGQILFSQVHTIKFEVPDESNDGESFCEAEKELDMAMRVEL